jgi:hypothetical protein
MQFFGAVAEGSLGDVAKQGFVGHGIDRPDVFLPYGLIGSVLSPRFVVLPDDLANEADAMLRIRIHGAKMKFLFPFCPLFLKSSRKITIFAP